jgi:hypothetical protein
VQVALGLDLYGSPKALFILYAVWGFLLLVTYFVLSYLNQPDLGFDETGTYITDRTESTGRSHRDPGLGKLAAAGAAGAGLAALRRRSRSRSRRGHSESRSRPTVLSSRRSSRQSESYVTNEKYTEDGRRGHTWKDRLFGAAAAGGGILAFKSLFNRNKKQATTESGSEVSYSRPIGPSEVTQTDLSRLEEGRAPASPANDRWRRAEEREAAEAAPTTGSPLRNAGPRRSRASMDSFDSRTSYSDEHDSRPNQSHTARNGIAALGVAGFLKYQWNKRRNRKEDARVEEVRQQDLEEEQIARADSQRRRYTGDGQVPPRRNRRPSTVLSDSDISGTTPALSRPNIPPPPRSTTDLGTSVGPSIVPVAAPIGVLSESGSEEYTSPGGGRHHRHRASGSGALAGGAAMAGSSRRDDSRKRSEGSVASPPVSVKVKMHNDGRHVTLRRLNEEEAAAEREARRKDRQQKKRNGSASSLNEFSNDRWRRNEALEAQQAAAPQPPIPMPEPFIPVSHPLPPGQTAAFSHQIPLPPPPPIPAAAGSGMSSPQGTNIYDTGTDISNYDNNRKRRRAERAQVKQARQGGSRVEFL